MARLGDRDLFQRFQRRKINVFVVELGDCGLVTLLGLAPAGHYFGQTWWLGQSHFNWSAVASCDQGYAKKVVRSVRKLGVDYKSIPMQLINIGGWFLFQYGTDIPVWNSDVVIGGTVPLEARDGAIQAIRSSEALMYDFLLPGRVSSSTRICESHGTVEIEKAFSAQSTSGTYYRSMYTQLGEAELVQQTFSKEQAAAQASELDEHIAQLESFAKRKQDKIAALLGAQRQQYIYFLNALELQSSLASKVRKVNRLRAEILASMDAPHFFASLEMRTPDTAGELRKRYKYLPNDDDWLHWLNDNSPSSLGQDRAIIRQVQSYKNSIRNAYPCLATDPLKSCLPRLASFARPALPLPRPNVR